MTESKECLNMKLEQFMVKFRETGGYEYNIEVIAADEFSAAHIAEYSLSDEVRAITKVVGVMAIDSG